MNNKKTTRRALFSSVMALLLCCSMLLGTTFAWFTDSVTSSGNIIKSGTLDVKLYYGDSTDAMTELTNETKEAIFDYKFWEPGFTQTKYIKIKNAGDLAFQYQLHMLLPKDAPEDASKLAEVIDVYCAIAGEGFDASERDILGSMTKLGTLKELMGNAKGVDDGILLPATGKSSASVADITGEIYTGEVTACIALQMQEEAGNDYQNLSVGKGFNIQIIAAQMTYERDSFNELYDQNAEWPAEEYPTTVDQWDGTADMSWYNDTDTEFALTTAEALAGLAVLVDSGNNFDGKTIKLGTDIDLADLPFNPIGHSANGKSFNGTFDGQGHTISNMYEQSNLDSNNGGWLYEGEYYGLFAYTNGATIKNVTIADAYISSGRNEAAGVVGNAVDTAFSDITISNTTLIAYNNSAGGVAAECYGNCSFTNITVDEDTVIGPLWGTYDVRLGGVVGLVHAGNNVTFSNITVACQLDAINDVAANYQYWLYRYSGMLIGHVDGVNGVADPTGYVTCENVTVIYGDWVNYHYCEDADLGAGSYNGPGEYKYARVEAGTGTDGIDLTACNHNEDESHNVLIVFDQLFGGGQGVKGLKTYDGVTVIYNNK